MSTITRAQRAAAQQCRLAREGFVPVNAPKGAKRSAMLRPKPVEHYRRIDLPAIGDLWLASALGRLAPDERKALDWIVNHADVVAVDGEPVALVVEVDQRILDVLATFGAEVEDRECVTDDEPDEGKEDDSASDAAFDPQASLMGIPRCDDEHDHRSGADRAAARERYKSRGRRVYWEEAGIEGRALARQAKALAGRVTP